MSAHRVLRDLFRAYENVGPGLGKDPGNAGTMTPELWGQQFLITTAGAETRTLARPAKAGLLVSVVLDTRVGDLTLTVTGGYDAAGDTTIVFGDAGDMVTFMSVKTGTTFQWTIVSHEGTDAPLFIGNTAITATAAQLSGAVAAPVLPSEHAAGAIGTAATPKTRRWTENGVIVTQTTFDVTGLASINDADDVIGLAAGAPAAFIGQNVVATNGVIFRAELSCLETPVTGATDIDVKFAATAAGALDTDGAAYGSLINGASLIAGQTAVNNTPAVTANHYYYLTAGTGAAGTYTAGMFVLTTYGHAVLA